MDARPGGTQPRGERRRPRPCGRRARGSRATGRALDWASARLRAHRVAEPRVEQDVLPPGVRTSTAEWPSQVIVVSRPSRHRCLLAAVAAPHRPDRYRRPRDVRIHSGRARPADRDEPLADQLDRPRRWRSARSPWSCSRGSLTPATRGSSRSRRRAPSVRAARLPVRPAPPGDLARRSPVAGDPTFDVPRRAALARLLSSLALLDDLVIARGGRARARAVAGLGGAGAGARARGADLGRQPGRVPLAVQLWSSPPATGGVFAAMILGHWYLVTPKLPEAPLVLVSRAPALGRRAPGRPVRGLGRFGIGPGATGGPFAALVGPCALFVWLRLIVGLVFPLVVSWAALQTAKHAVDGDATGLLYINVGTIAVGHDPRRGAVLRRRAAGVGCRDDAAIPPLRIRVRLFAMQREAAGTRELPVEVAAGRDRRRRLERGGRARSRRSPPAGPRCGSRSTASTRTTTRPSPTATSSPASRR